MKRFKRLMCLVLAILFIFTGCGSNKNQDKEVSSDLKGFHETGFPVLDEPITLKIMGPSDTARTVSWENNEAFKHLQEITNIKLEMELVDKSSYNEKLSLTLAGGDLPDIFIGGGFNNSSLAQQCKQGNIIDLKPYIEKYGENIKKHMAETDEFTKNITLDNGMIPSLPFLNINVEDGKCPRNLFLIYQPWLDKLGLDMPKTTDELYTVLKAFKEKDPNGNGKADEIPLVPRDSTYVNTMFSFFGVMVSKEDSYLFVDDDRVTYAPLNEGFKEGLEYIHKLYSERLLDKEVFTQNAQQVLAKGNGADAIIGSTIATAGFVVVGEERAKVMLPAMISKTGNVNDIVWDTRNYVNPGYFEITKACKYPEVAIRLADYLYSEDGAKLIWMGTEDESFKVESDGSWDWIYKDGQSSDEVRAINSIAPTFNVGAFPMEWFKLSSGTEAVVNKQRVEIAEKYGDNLRLACPKLVYDTKDEKDVATISADLNAYIDQSIAKFITGDMDIEADWNSFETKIKSMRVDDLLKYAQSAYDKYNSIK